RCGMRCSGPGSAGSWWRWHGCWPPARRPTTTPGPPGTCRPGSGTRTTTLATRCRASPEAPSRSPGRGSGAVAADHLRLVGQLAAVPDQEAAHAGELVGLLGLDLDRELLGGQVGPGQLEGLRGLGLVLVDLAGVLVMA